MANKNGKTLITFDANSAITYEIHGDVFRFLNIPYSPRKSFVQFSNDFYFWFPKISNKGIKDDIGITQLVKMVSPLHKK